MAETQKLNSMSLRPKKEINDPDLTKGGRDIEVKFDESETQEAHNDPDSDDLLGEAI